MVWLVGQADAGWAGPVPAVVSPRWPGRRAVRRPAGGRIGGRIVWTKARAGLYRPTYREVRERKERREPAERPAVPTRMGHKFAGVGCAGMKMEGHGLQELLTAQTWQ